MQRLDDFRKRFGNDVIVMAESDSGILESNIQFVGCGVSRSRHQLIDEDGKLKDKLPIVCTIYARYGD